jgi:hypothetical protein
MAVKTGWSCETPTKLYAIAAGRRSSDSRIYPVMVLAAVTVLWLVAMPQWILILWIPLLVLTIYRLFRPLGDKWYVELGSDALVVQFLGRTCLSYRDLVSADRRIPQGLSRLFRRCSSFGANFGEEDLTKTPIL